LWLKFVINWSGAVVTYVLFLLVSMEGKKKLC